MSGSALSWWSLSRDPRVDAFALGRILNIPTNDTKKLMDTLKDTPTESILEAEAYIYEETATQVNFFQENLSLIITMLNNHKLNSKVKR